MNNEILKNAVAQVIKENGNEEITGNILQQVLIAMINSLGLGFQFIGEAKPETNPGTPDARVFYFAQDAGTYSNFDGLVLDGSSVAVFFWGDSWTHLVINIPTTTGLDARYLKISDLAVNTGASTTTAMTQKAVSDALSLLASEISQLGQEVDDYDTYLKPSLKLRTPANLLYELVVGYVTEDGSTYGSSSYRHTQKIKVSEGDILTLWDLRDENNPQSLSAMRFVCAYLNGVAQSSKGSSTTSGSYIVPSGVDEVVVSIHASYFESPYVPMLIFGSVAPYHYYAPESPLYEAMGALLPDMLTGAFKRGYWRVTKNSVTNDTLILARSNLVKNVSYFFTGKFSTFNTLIIGHSSSSLNYYALCRISSTTVVFDINGHEYKYTHGVTLADYINVKLIENDNSRIALTLESNGQSYTKTIGWDGFGRNGSYRATIAGTMTDVVFSVTCKDLKDAPVHIYGDSFIAVIEATTKWTHWLVQDGYGDNFLLNAFPGAKTSDLFPALKTNLAISTPRAILWTCGMNDGADTDASTPNATWLSNINQVLLICEQYGVEPILATTPSVPSILNEGKNAWVRESGYRYVDIAKAVGATSAGVWFNGMLSSDNVHPTELGAIAISRRVYCDFPDIVFNK